jgi:hypothetical protein
MIGLPRRRQSAGLGNLGVELRKGSHPYLKVNLPLLEGFRAAEGELQQAIAAAPRQGRGVALRQTIGCSLCLLVTLPSASHCWGF